MDNDLDRIRHRLTRLQARAEEKHAALSTRIRELDDIEKFMALAPKARATLEELSTSLFGELLDDVEDNLTHGLREILGQDRKVRTIRTIKHNRLSLDFEILNQDNPENVLAGQGGSVCNILSVSLRLIALSQLDPAAHRPFLVLDEQDCWLKPSLVPKFMKLIHRTCKRLKIQALVISHHPLDLFSCDADRIYTLTPDRENGVKAEMAL